MHSNPILIRVKLNPINEFNLILSLKVFSLNLTLNLLIKCLVRNPILNFVPERMNYSRWSTIRRGFSNIRLWEQLELVRDQYKNLETSLRGVNKLPIIHSEGYVCGLPINHRFQMTKFRQLFNVLVK